MRDRERAGGWALFVFAFMAFFSVQAAQAQPQDQLTVLSTYWSVTPIQMAPNPETQTRQLERPLFAQDFRSTDTASLPSAASLTVPPQFAWNPPLGQIGVEPSSSLVRVLGMRDGIVYCSGATSFHGGNMNGRKARHCLYDRDRDGIFDRIYWMDAVGDAAMAGGAYVNMVLRANGLSHQYVALPYTVDAAPSARMFTAGPIVRRSGLGVYRVNIGILSGSNVEPLQGNSLQNTRADGRPEPADAATTYFRAEDLPLTVELLGARIEIQAVNGDNVSYKVQSQFAPGQVLGFSYNHDMPLATAPAE